MFPIVEVKGSAFERGRRHGQRARAMVERSIATYARLFAFCGLDWSEAQKRAARFCAAVNALDPDLSEEMEGIAAGSGRRFSEILTLNARTEVLPPAYPGKPAAEWEGVAERNRRAGVPDWGECTALAIPPALSGTGGTLLAQNWDWLGRQRQALIILRITEDDGTGVLTLTEGGILAKIGLNSHGFGVCLNILRSRDDGTSPGVPVHVLLRALLRCRGVSEAIALAGKLSFGASSNIHCADVSGDCAALECYPRGLYVIRERDKPLLHTNHFLCGAPQGQEVPPTEGLSSRPRLERLQRLLSGLPVVALSAVQRILRDESEGLRSICRRPDPAIASEVRLESVAGVIMELEARIMHVAPDIPSRTGFQPVALAGSPPPA